MLDVRFVQPDLRRLDELTSEALLLPFFSDERPLRGALGLVDWRLCGWLSRLVQSGRLTGQRGETLLVPARRRLAFEKLFVFGLGPQDRFDEEVFEEAMQHMLNTLARARVRASACTLPGRSVGRIEPEDAMARFLALALAQDDHDLIVLLESPEAQRAMEPVLEREKRRLRAQA